MSASHLHRLVQPPVTPTSWHWPPPYQRYQRQHRASTNHSASPYSTLVPSTQHRLFYTPVRQSHCAYTNHQRPPQASTSGGHGFGRCCLRHHTASHHRQNPGALLGDFKPPVFAFAHSLSVFPPLQLPNSPVLAQPVLLVMASTSLFRLATRTVRPASFVRAPQMSRVRVQQTPIALAINRPSFSTTSMRLSGAHEDETYEEFSSRYAAAHYYFWE